MYAALRAMIRWRDADWRVEIDGEEHGFTGYSVAVANTGVFGGGMFLVPDASVDDGLLDVALLRHCSKPRYLARLPKVFKGTHVDSPELTLLRGKEVTFDALDSLALAIAAMTGMVNDMEPVPEAMRRAAGRGYSTATDLADWLVRRLDLPFREAHHVTGRIVADAESRGVELEELPLGSPNGLADMSSNDDATPLRGKPPPIPLPIVMISGLRLYWSHAHIVPVRPNPVSTSSAMSSASNSSAISRTA